MGKKCQARKHPVGPKHMCFHVSNQCWSIVQAKWREPLQGPRRITDSCQAVNPGWNLGGEGTLIQQIWTWQEIDAPAETGLRPMSPCPGQPFGQVMEFWVLQLSLVLWMQVS